MPLMTTREHFERLSDAQLTVLRVLLEGGTVTDAAMAARVSRQTASEWKNRNPSFIAMLNAGRLDVWSHVEDRIRKLTGKAIAVLENEVELGNVSVARDILRSAGKLELNKVGPTDPQLVRNEIDDADQALMFSQLARTLQKLDAEREDS
jgi:hypothetical protein